MSKKESNQKKVTLSKESKSVAANILDPHRRGNFIRIMLEAENHYYISRFTKSINTKEISAE